jgi:hypothetical protein
LTKNSWWNEHFLKMLEEDSRKMLEEVLKNVD